MGDVVSSGQSNDELIDNLVDANYISKKEVEMAFRAVDRGDYMLPDHMTFAYRDIAWRYGQLHLSAPSIYCEVMNALELGENMSFLNIGSGTGYLSTIAGLLIGANGLNHGIEINADIVNYANRRLQEFMDDTSKYDVFDFCPPQFFCGNGLLMPETMKYDRVYCGAACPYGEPIEQLKKLVKLGGKLVVPLNKYLMVYDLHNSGECQLKNLLPVSFASMVQTSAPYNIIPTVPTVSPLTLQEKCRVVLRRILRKVVLQEHPELFQNSSTEHYEQENDNSRKRPSGSSMSSDMEVVSEDDENLSLSHSKNEGYTSDDSSPLPLPSASMDILTALNNTLTDEEDNNSDASLHSSSSSSSGNSTKIDDNVQRVRKQPNYDQLKFSQYLTAKIIALKLPKPLAVYLNMGRPI